MNTENKIMVDQLCAYLPYSLQMINTKSGKIIDVRGLRITVDSYVITALVKKVNEFVDCDFQSDLWPLKPILRPMSDLYNTTGFSVSDLITHGYHNQFWSKGKFSVKHIYYHDLLILLKHHFDVFGLIEKKLAISIHDIEKK